jgi:hypothetical protein
MRQRRAILRGDHSPAVQLGPETRVHLLSMNAWDKDGEPIAWLEYQERKDEHSPWTKVGTSHG